NTRLKIALVAGENAQSLKNLEIDSHKGLAGKTFLARQSQTDENLVFDKNIFDSAAALKNLTSAVSVPVMRGADADAFGLLVLYGDKEKTFNQSSRKLLESVAERVAPLFSNSLAFERNVANSLTDALTNLPNERAFYLVLENQIAESQRFREERPLTILTVDIKNFAGLNERFGHAAGDRILTFAADLIKEQLRQMDFLARSASDEFLAVLPTAPNKTAAEIVGRVEKAFAAKPFETSRQEKTYLLLNFGIATFLKDGETAGQLLQVAYLRKQQAKAPGKSSVLLFPKEFVN
ncbi:MAG: sensor domain-containing diguanylate cyclase, partial [Acidobacteriota bacterium]|nr:sensor domain-containing diguanylate cyclase [Acidobacteriota bacterium]